RRSDCDGTTHAVEPHPYSTASSARYRWQVHPPTRLQPPCIAAVSSLVTALALAVLPLVIADALPAAAQIEAMDIVSVQLGDYFLDPPELNVVAGQTVTFQLENIGVTTHALEINGQGVEL